MMNKLRVLIANVQLDHRTGTETYTYDLANELLRLGHIPWVYSPKLGDIASELRGKGATVVDDLDLLPGIPDVIHSHHTIETFLTFLYFPQTPGLFVCHDRLSWHSRPPLTSRIARYIAVDHNCLDRLIESSIPEEKTRVFFNPVDLKRFQVRASLPVKPRKALIFSNYANKNNYIAEVGKACSAMEISLDVLGEGVQKTVAKPEDLLGQYDIVFAKARCALEAMACGVAVIPCDEQGCAPIVILQNVEAMRSLNFGMKILKNPITRDFLKVQILAYDPAEAGKVSAWIRAHASLEEHVKEYGILYEEIIKERQSALLSDPGHEARSQKDLYRKICSDLENVMMAKEQTAPSADRAGKLIREAGYKLWDRFKGNTA